MPGVSFMTQLFPEPPQRCIIISCRKMAPTLYLFTYLSNQQQTGVLSAALKLSSHGQCSARTAQAAKKKSYQVRKIAQHSGHAIVTTVDAGLVTLASPQIASHPLRVVIARSGGVWGPCDAGSPQKPPLFRQPEETRARTFPELFS